MTDHVVLQEDRFEFPPEWRSLLLARRGDGVDHRYAIGSFAAVAELTERHRPALEEALSNAKTDPELARRAREHLDGRPDPAGTAAVAILVRRIEHHQADTATGMNNAKHPRGLDALTVIREHLDSWVSLHGTAFAVAAAVEDLATETAPSYVGKDWFVRPASHLNATKKINLWAHGDDGPIAALRRLVAAASDDEHARICALVAGHRDTPVKRIAAALLIPDRTDWATEALAEHLLPREGAQYERLTWSIVSAPEHVATMGRKAFEPYHLSRETVAEAIAGLGAAVLPLVVKTLGYKATSATDRRDLFAGVALLPTDEAMALLLDRIDDQHARTAAADGAARFPARAARLVAVRALAAPPLERARLGAVLAAHPDRNTAALPALAEAERATLAALTAETALPEAEPEQLPQVLIAPPWTNKRKPKAPSTIEGLASAPAQIVGRPGEFERAMAIEPDLVAWDEDEYWSNEGFERHLVGLSLADSGLAQLARKGPAVANDVVDMVHELPGSGGALVPVRSTAAAAVASHWLVRVKSGRGPALDWFDRHGLHAARLLVPEVFGPKPYQRASARAGLRLVSWRHGAEAVLEAVEPHGPEAVEGIAAILGGDPNQPLLNQPNPGYWADPDNLPPVRLKGRKTVLPRTAVVHLIGILSQWEHRVPYPGLAEAARHLDRASLAQFSLALAQLWIDARSPLEDAWVIPQLARFGGADAARLLEAQAPRWHARRPEWATAALDTLAALPAAIAFAPLYRLSRNAKKPEVRDRAATRCAAVAERLGADPETLADRDAPTLGLDGTPMLDYGPRAFRVNVDDRLNLSVTDADGKTRARPPKPGVKDDADTAADALARFRHLAKALPVESAYQCARMEDAMLNGRIWNAAEFTELTAHPVLGNLARRLLWFGETPTGPTGFRMAEDGSLADIDDKPFALEGDARVRLAHPALLGTDLTAWTQVFADYEVLQPFDQLARPGLTLNEAEATDGILYRFEGRTATFAALSEVLDWTLVGWGDHLPAGARSNWTRLFQRELPGGARLLAELDPSPDTSEPEPGERHRVLAIWFSATKNRRQGVPTLRGDALDPVHVSEILAGLSRATGLLH